MRKEFVRTYLKRVAILGPLVAVVVLVPPAPLAAKIASMGAFLVIVLLELLVEVLVIAHNAGRAAAVDVSRDTQPTVPGTRRHYRLAQPSRKQSHASTNQPSIDEDLNLPRD